MQSDLEELRKGLGGEADIECELTIFEAVRKGRAITIELRDYGVGASGGRYEVTAKDGAKQTRSNPENSIDAACSVIHWHGFD